MWGERSTDARSTRHRRCPRSAGTPTTSWSRSICALRAGSTLSTARRGWWSTTPPGWPGRRRRTACGSIGSRAARTDVAEVTALEPTLDPMRFRRVFGHFCTGVTIVTSVDSPAGEPVGFACQAFAALSLDPPLVLFCPAVASATWPRIERAGHFCINVLAEEQRELSRVFGSSGPHRFAGLTWSSTRDGAPVLDGVLAWAACQVEAVHPAGDHLVVVGRVTELGECSDGRPLLFYKGQYTGATALPDVVESL